MHALASFESSCNPFNEIPRGNEYTGVYYHVERVNDIPGFKETRLFEEAHDLVSAALHRVETLIKKYKTVLCSRFTLTPLKIF